jgi:SAM-dependent methyltransferase
VFECGVAQRLPYRDGAFDRAFSISTLEHLRQDEEAVREVGRVLKPNGRAVFTMDTWWSPGHEAGPDRDDVLRNRHIEQLYRLPDAAVMFDACGFEVEDAFYLIRSGLSQQLHRMGARLGYSGSLLYVMLFPVLYALSIIADSGVSRDREGYVLVIVATRSAT